MGDGGPVPAVQHGDDAGHGCASPADARTVSPGGCTPWAGSRQIPCGDGAMRAPGQPDVAHLARRGRLVQAFQAAIAFAHAIVVHRQDVGPLQRVDQNISTVQRPRAAASGARSARRRTGARRRRGSGPRRPQPPVRCREWRPACWPTGRRRAVAVHRWPATLADWGSPRRGTAPASAPGWLRRRGHAIAGGRWRAPALHTVRGPAWLRACRDRRPRHGAPSRRPGRPGISGAPVGAGDRSAGMAARGISVLVAGSSRKGSWQSF